MSPCFEDVASGSKGAECTELNLVIFKTSLLQSIGIPCRSRALGELAVQDVSNVLVVSLWGLMLGLLAVCTMYVKVKALGRLNSGC